MKLYKHIPCLIVAVFAWIIIISSCANQGMPAGGPRDSIPPELVNTQPKYKTLNFKGNEVRLTFNEYIIPDQVSEILVVSPPLSKRPTILTKSKTLIVQFNEELRDSVTYSLDFKNAVVDNNERNPFGNLRFSFSTGEIYDSLRVAGKVLNGFNLEPVENALVMLYKNLHDSAVFRTIPDYIAKTDEKGLFLIDNIMPGNYGIYAINDANADLMYNEGAEEIAFWDTVIVPSAEFVPEPDTLAKGADSMLILGHTRFYPDPLYLRQFMEDIFDQYLDSYRRDSRYKCSFVFNESVADSFGIRIPDYTQEDWYILEPNPAMDSITLWIADTTLAGLDTLMMEIAYFQLDTLNELYVRKDTLAMIHVEKEDDQTKKRRRGRSDEEEEVPVIPQFNWTTNLSSSVFDINGAIHLDAPEPVYPPDSSKIRLYLTRDTLKNQLNFSFTKDTAVWRRYNLVFPWEPEEEYTLELDSAACENIYGITSRKMIKKFKIREEDYYGTISLNLTGINCPVIAQLLKNSDKEEVIAQKVILADGKVIFDYLTPEKYIIKVILDENGNGKWDPGSFQDKYQPESVAYINEVIKVRGNWDSSFNWELKPDRTYTKVIIDVELEEQKKKEAAEKAKQELENERRQENNLFQGEGGVSNPMRMR